MKRFIVISLGFVFVAMVLTIAVWWWVQTQIQSAVPPTSEPLETEDSVAPTETQSVDESIPLRDVPLSDGQRKAAETMGVDVETFEITPAMIDCARTSLGSARVDEIVVGDTPSVLESFKLMGCVKAE